MRVANTPARWAVCFLALPALWIAGSFATDFQAVSMVPAAVFFALLSALTAYRSGRGSLRTFGYLLGTGAMMGIAFFIAIVVLFTLACGDGSTEGVC